MYFSGGNQTVCPTLKKINHGLPLCQNNVNGVYIWFLRKIQNRYLKIGSYDRKEKQIFDLVGN
jgi:hypothetical protein